MKKKVLLLKYYGFVLPFTAFNLGQGLVAGASIVGLGALCFYGLGLSNKAGAIDRSV